MKPFNFLRKKIYTFEHEESTYGKFNFFVIGFTLSLFVTFIFILIFGKFNSPRIDYRIFESFKRLVNYTIFYFISGVVFDIIVNKRTIKLFDFIKKRNGE